MSIKKILPVILALSLWFSNAALPVSGAANDFYVSPAGDDANACTATAPCKTIQKGVNMLQAGSVLHILAGTYSESVTVSKVGTQSAPIRIVGEGAILSNGGVGAFAVYNSQWVTFEGLTITGYTGSDIEIKGSHYLTFRNNKLQYLFAAIRIKTGTSHLLIENNEMYQTLPAGSTWSTIKSSPYEGAGVYASSDAQGMYVIRNNNFHDSMNGVYISDLNIGNWMNANIFISNNTFTNIMDDPFEPEGDSFNIHFFNNTLVNTHRMASVVPKAECIGPIFVYGNYQLNTLDPTGESITLGRKNSAVKFDMRSGTCPNGVYVFNNTVRGPVAGTNFYAVDLLDPAVWNFQLLNNVFVTEKNAYSRTPSFTNAAFDYDISLMPFGYEEPNGIQSDPVLNADGMLAASSPAAGRSTSIAINTYFASSQIVPAGADLGAFKSFPQPVYVLPPGGEPADFPANVAGWPNDSAPPPATASPMPTVSPTVAVSPTPVTSLTPVVSATPSTVPTMAASSTPVASLTPRVSPTVAVSPTPVTSLTPVVSATPSTVPTMAASSTPVASLTPMVSPTASAVPPQAAISTPTTTATTAAIPTASAVSSPIASTPTVSSAPSTTTTYDSKDPALVFSTGWSTVKDAKSYNGSYRLTSTIGSTMNFKFSGTSLSLLYTTKKIFGSVEVYIDNTLVGVLNQKTSSPRYKQRWDSLVLPAGTHELKLVFIGPKGTSGSMDAIIIR